MIVALIDNGSLERAALDNLRAVAGALSVRTGTKVHAVSWKHSNRIPMDAAEDTAVAWTLAPFVRAMFALGQREFIFVPFFISAQGAIGSALREDLEHLRAELPGLEFSFTDGLAARGAIAPIIAARIRETITAQTFKQSPSAIVVDHGGPSPVSATLRDSITAEVAAILGDEVRHLSAASMEGARFAHNQPLFEQQLGAPHFDRGDLVVAPLFLSPGRHAGPAGDLATISRTQEDRLASRGLKCHFTGLVGTHPLAVNALAAALRDSLSQLHAQPFA